MSITGKCLQNKLSTLRPDLASSVTLEMLNELCDDASVQPFLKWFCADVGSANVLSEEEMHIKSKLENTGEWLEDDDVTAALEDMLQDCPEVLQLISLDDNDADDLIAESETMMKSRNEDTEYVETLRDGLQNLREQEQRLIDLIEEANECLKKEQIETNKAYNDCTVILKELNESNHAFSKDTATLWQVYADAIKNKGSQILWTQMPLEKFMKQIELFNDYVAVYIRRQFQNTNKEVETDSDYVSLMNESNEKCLDEQIQELMLCKTNLTNAKIQEMTARLKEETCIAMLEYIEHIYNNGTFSVPTMLANTDLRRQIQELIGKRDFLEETVILLRERHIGEIAQLIELKTTKVLKHDADLRLDTRKSSLQKLQNIRSFAREHGHVHADLLCVLLDMQFRCLEDIADFVSDTCHYLSTEYSLCSSRRESMKTEQNEFNTLLIESLTPVKSFEKKFACMIHSSDEPKQNYALEKYNELIENMEQKMEHQGMNLMFTLKKLQLLGNEINIHYNNEIRMGPICNLKETCYEIDTCHDNTIDNMQRIQSDLGKIRNRLKEWMKTQINLQREKDILWQRFLTAPDTIRKLYDYENLSWEENKCSFGDISQIE